MRIVEWKDYTGDPARPPQGAFSGVPFAVYARWPYLSKSALQDFAEIPAKHLARVTGQLPRKESDAYAVGSAVDPWCEDTVADCQVWSGASRRGTGFDAFRAEHPDAIILTQPMADAVVGMRAALDKHDGALATRDGAVAQLSLVYDDPTTGLRLKGRPDLVDLDRGILADLKTARRVTAHGFAADASEYNYHWQAWLYRAMIEGLGLGEIRECRIIAVKNTPIHSVAVRPFADETLEIAGDELRALLWQYRECVIHEQWPADYDDETPIRLPRWRRGRGQ